MLLLLNVTPDGVFADMPDGLDEVSGSTLGCKIGIGAIQILDRFYIFLDCAGALQRPRDVAWRCGLRGIHEDVDMVRHDFQSLDSVSVFGTGFLKDDFQRFVFSVLEDGIPELRTPDDMILRQVPEMRSAVILFTVSRLSRHRPADTFPESRAA